MIILLDWWMEEGWKGRDMEISLGRERNEVATLHGR